MELYSKVLGAGQPLIILHGFLGMSDNWKTLGKKYADSGLEVHLLDQRNHGRSGWEVQFDYPTMAADLLEYMDNKGLSTANVLGHSMGGKTAMEFACRYPSRVSTLLVADIAPKYYPPHHKQILDALNTIPLEKMQSRTEADDYLAESIPEWGVRQFLLKNLYWESPKKLGFRFNLEVLSNSMEAIGATLESNAAYNGPVLFLRGGNSDYIKDSDAPLMKKHFPDYQLVTIPETGHWLHAEKPDVFFEKTITFIKS
ncbi:alpha/beta fold hydrolase [Robiginitalea sp. IMCC43444]|uniref:alpha/beta fold hydrolase n=1 Tax=Robiginitalea sp. IMCC43444 TaxID=3459121 RepID=UPI0040417A16